MFKESGKPKNQISVFHFFILSTKHVHKHYESSVQAEEDTWKTHKTSHITMWHCWPTPKPPKHHPSIHTVYTVSEPLWLVKQTDKYILTIAINTINTKILTFCLLYYFMITDTLCLPFIDAEPTTSSIRFHEYVDRISFVIFTSRRRSF